MTFYNDLMEIIRGYYSDLVIFLPKLLVGILAFLIFWWLGGRSKRVIKSRLANKIDDPLLTDFLAQIAKITWTIIGFLIFLGAIGWGDAATGILATAGVSAFVIGFAFKDIGENFLAGIVMAFKRPYKMGDVIETNGIVGKITTMSLRDTLVKTFDGKDVYIPNGMILKSPLKNYTIDGFLRYDFNIRMDFNTDFERAGQIVLEQLSTIEGILQEVKPPSITVEGFENEVAMLKVYFWINTYDESTSIFKIKTQAFSKCIKALKEAGMYLPHQVIELRNLPSSSEETKAS